MFLKPSVWLIHRVTVFVTDSRRWWTGTNQSRWQSLPTDVLLCTALYCTVFTGSTGWVRVQGPQMGTSHHSVNPGRIRVKRQVWRWRHKTNRKQSVTVKSDPHHQRRGLSLPNSQSLWLWTVEVGGLEQERRLRLIFSITVTRFNKLWTRFNFN